MAANVYWAKYIDRVAELLRNSPEYLGHKEIAENVSRTIGRRVTYSAVKNACMSHLGLPIRDILGSSYTGQTYRPSIANASIPQHPEFCGVFKDGHVHERGSNAPPSTSGRLRKIAVTGDWHSPYHDKSAISVLFAALDKWRPDTIVLNGDILDCYTISRFESTPDRISRLEDEVAITNDLLDLIKCKDVHFIEGNHENRLPRHLAARSPALWNMLSIRELLGIDKRGWGWHSYRGDALKIGRMSFKHDIGRCGKYALSQSLCDFGGNIAIGHTHRGGTTYQSTVKGKQMVALSTGWLGDTNLVDYRHVEMARRDFQHGFGMVYLDESTGNAYPQFKAIFDGRCEIDGELVSP